MEKTIRILRYFAEGLSGRFVGGKREECRFEVRT